MRYLKFIPLLFLSAFVAADQSMTKAGSSGVTIGNAVTGGTANRVILEGADNTVSENTNLAYSTTTRVLSVDSVTAASTGTFNMATITTNTTVGGSLTVTGGATIPTINGAVQLGSTLGATGVVTFSTNATAGGSFIATGGGRFGQALGVQQSIPAVDGLEVTGPVVTSTVAAVSRPQTMFMDFLSGGTGRIYVKGPNTSTNPIFKIQTARSNDTNTLNPIYVDAAGNVGILNTLPNRALDVTGNGAVSNQFSAGSLVLGSGSTVTKFVSGSASLDFGATAAGTCDSITVTVTGAADGDVCQLGIPNALFTSDTYQSFNAQVTSSGVVTVKRCNLLNSVTALSNPAAATVKVTCLQ